MTSDSDANARSPYNTNGKEKDKPLLDAPQNDPTKKTKVGNDFRLFSDYSRHFCL